MTQENNAEMEGAREWTSRGMTRKIPSDGIVTGRQISLLYPPRSMGCAQQVEFIMQRLGDLAFNHSPRGKKKSKRGMRFHLGGSETLSWIWR